MRAQALFALIVLGLAACDRPAADPPPAPASKPVAAPVQAPAAGAVVAPKAFQGEWNADLAACGGAANELRLEIGAGRMRFHETSGPITKVAAAGPREATLTVDLTGEGQTFERVYRLRLSPDDQTLTDLDAGFDRKRCPG